MQLCPECTIEAPELGEGKCPNCGWHVTTVDGVPAFLSSKDISGELSQEYIKNYEELGEKNLVKSNIDRRFLHNQAKNIVHYLGNIAGKSVCEVGVGQGFLTMELLAQGVKQVTAVDVSTSYLKLFRNTEGVRPILANAENLPFSDEFDVLGSTDVMEHVLNVGSFLFCVNRALRMGGVVCIRVPYRESLLGYSPHMKYAHRFGHMRSFNKDILRIYMRAAGFANLRFHLDGFSLGTPQPWLYDTWLKQVIYNRIPAFLGKFVEHPADVTLWNSRVARCLMRPVEIVVIGRKVSSIEVSA